MTRPQATAIALASALAALAPAAAQAATVAVVDPLPAASDSTVTIRYQAAPGEANRLRLTIPAQDSTQSARDFTFEDPGAEVHAGQGCNQVDAHTAVCPEHYDLFFYPPQIRLGDRDDRLHASASVVADGGPGDDLLVGGGFDELDGGGGTDRLVGGTFDDVLTDGDRDGAPGNVGPNRDVLLGGAGDDTISYAGRRRGVTVNLADHTPTGEPGENDKSSGFEDATGGAGDELVGTNGDNVLVGHAGDDHLLGRGNSAARYALDRLYGGAGRDRLEGGDGNDWLVPGRGRDRFSCALGFDEVFDPVAGERVGRCEWMTFSGNFGDGDTSVSLPPHPKVHRRYLDYGRVICLRDQDGEPETCNGPLTVREAYGKHRLVGRGRVIGDRDVFPSGGTPPVHVRLTKLGRKLVHRPRGVVTNGFLHGTTLPTASWTTRIKP
jgi:hypothetical protein